MNKKTKPNHAHLYDNIIIIFLVTLISLLFISKKKLQIKLANETGNSRLRYQFAVKDTL